MGISGVASAILCVQIMVMVSEGKLVIEEPLHKHPTLVAMAEQNNACRAQSGLAKQQVSPYLTELAQSHANWMANSGRFQHNQAHSFQEIIYWNTGSVERAFAAWMSSGPHRAIILSGSTHVGFGYAISPNGETYWCGVFGTIRDEQPAKPAGAE